MINTATKKLNSIFIIICLPIASTFLAGCTTVKPIERNPQELQQQIRNGEIIEVGDHARIISQDGSPRMLIITEISEHAIKGELVGSKRPATWTGSEDGFYEEDPRMEAIAIEIPIDQVVLVEKKKIDAGKTSLAIGGGTIMLIVLFHLFIIMVFS